MTKAYDSPSSKIVQFNILSHGCVSSWMPRHSITAVWLLGINNLNQHRTSYFLFSR
jgi:hypothetical protein